MYQVEVIIINSGNVALQDIPGRAKKAPRYNAQNTY